MESNKRLQPVGVGIVTALVALYYLVSMASVGVVLFAPRDARLIWLTAPFGDDAAGVLRVVDAPKPGQWLALVESLHSGNPTVVYELARYQSYSGNHKDAGRLIGRVLELDPKNYSTFALRAEIASRSGEPITLTRDIMDLSRAFLDERTFARVVRGYAEHPPRIPRYADRKQLRHTYYTGTKPKELLGKLYYLLGYDLIEQDAAGAAYWWTLAAELDPGTSYYSVELANLYAHTLHDRPSALTVLERCRRESNAGAHCANAINDIGGGTVVDPGYFAQTVFDGLQFLEP